MTRLSLQAIVQVAFCVVFGLYIFVVHDSFEHNQGDMHGILSSSWGCFLSNTHDLLFVPSGKQD